MRVALLADAHVGGPGGSGELLVEQLDALDPSSCSQLVILGDLFQVWVAERRFETDEIRRVLPAIRALVDRGVPVHYVEGNRDFFLRRSAYESLFASVGPEHEFGAHGRRFLVVHGDGLNPADWRYRFWRFLSKNRLSRLFSTLIPGPVVDRVVFGTERRLGETNFEHKVTIPREVIADYARRRFASGYDVLLLGHYHRELRMGLSEGEVWILEAWFDSRSLAWVEE